MANITKHLTSISLDSRSSSPPGRRLLALTLVVMLVFGSTLPGLAWAGETDSEGEGSVPPVEVPVAPDFDPGGEEEGLEETPATGDEEEGGTVEAEIEVPPASEEVTGAATEAPVEAAPPPAVEPPPIPASPTPEAEPVQQEAAGESSEPVANQSITAPAQAAGAERSMASVGDGSGQSAAPAGPTQQEAPSPSPQPVSVAAPDPTQNLVGKDTYVVQPGDCLWHIAARLLPGGAGTEAVADKVAELWRLNEDRIGTGDPNLIYAGTELRLR